MAIDDQEKLQRLQQLRIPKVKTKKGLAQQSEKKKQEIKEEKVSGEGKALKAFFERCRQHMTGKCLFCGGKTERDNDNTYKNSIAHLLPKRKNQFPSVATHLDNWIELCFFGNSCHTNFDSGRITWEFLADSKEFDVIKEKFLKVYPSIAEKERRNIPEVLRKLVK